MLLSNKKKSTNDNHNNMEVFQNYSEARDEWSFYNSIYVKFLNSQNVSIVVERELVVALDQDFGKCGWFGYKEAWRK